ncbi:MAG: dolichyl-phosphate beta-glucosyltransferase [Candidatus Micrarchaeia archaeon]
MENKTVSIILPVHNEEKVLLENVRRLERMLEGVLSDFEILISEDGSTDRTLEVARRLRSGRIRLFHNALRQGKGAAIRIAAGEARGNTIIFMDADLASDPTHIREFLDLMGSGAAIVIGSRYLRESKTKRDPMRYLASRGFNLLVRVVLGSRLTDHQCGFKAFRKDLVLPLINEVQDDGWFWDTEMLVRAQRKGLKIAEVPIAWKEARGSKFRMLSDSARMGCSLLGFKIRNG